jgi:TRAP-type mannitol/chloroaromatic compound transport system substrate-binding protein
METLTQIKDSLKTIHSEIINDIFYSDNDLFATDEIDETFKNIIDSISNYESKINEYTYSNIPDNLFEDELLNEFNI